MKRITEWISKHRDLAAYSFAVLWVGPVMSLSAGLPLYDGLLWAAALTIVILSEKFVSRVVSVAAFEVLCVGVLATVSFGLAMQLGPLGLDPVLALAIGVMMGVLQLPRLKRWQKRTRKDARQNESRRRSIAG
jgi:hypothetical protein